MFGTRFSDIVRCTVIGATMMGAMWLGSARADAPEEGAKPIALRVLYAGNPNSDRAADFEKLLKEHFAAVKVADYRKFQPADAKDFDVVIFDWTSIYPRDDNGKINFEKEGGIASPQSPPLTRQFDRPAILIGAAGGSLTHSLGIAINWK